MTNICTKLKQREKNKYRKIMTTEAEVYANSDIHIVSSTPYTPGASLEDGEWFSIQNASEREYRNELMTEGYVTADFDSLTRKEFETIDFIFIIVNNLICFQNVSRAKLVSKKSILYLGESFSYQEDRKEIVINHIPDAIYDRDSDVLYFKHLESITSIFRGIDLLFKEATNEETEQFLSSDFIQLKEGYNAAKVKTANRKRIALAQNTLAALDADSKGNIFAYIGEYCPELKASDTSFEIGTEEELKLLLYGIEQRFYTTVVGNEKRIANSVVPLSAK